MISIRNLTFHYPSSANVITNVNYVFEKGNTYLITGRNGVGKTTFLKLLLGLLKPTEGTITFDVNSIISYLPDHNGLYEDLSIINNVIFRLSLYKIKFKQKKVEFYQLLEKYKMKGKEHMLVKNLSLGMKKKVGIICSILIDANIYIFDEPTGGLDSETTLEIKQLLLDLASKNVLVICISHEETLKNGLHGIKLNLEGGFLS